jgi:predicted permease
MWRRYLRFWRNDVHDDVDDELRFHADMRIAEYVARGMSAEDARHAVRTRLGDVDAARSECIALGETRERNARPARFVDEVRADVTYALRSLRHAPGWTSVALLTIALGVGATTTVFRVADALLVRPFPYPDASRVFLVRREFTVDGTRVPASLPLEIVPIWRSGARSIEGLAPFGGFGDAQLATGNGGLSVRVARIDTAFLDFSGSQVLLGRNFTAHEMAPRGPGALLVSEQLWRTRFGASPDVIGQPVELEGERHTIVGIVPAAVTIPDFRFERADVFVPISLERSGGSVLVRLRPGISREIATEELRDLLARASVFDVKPVPMPMPLRLTKPQDWLPIGEPLALLTVAVGLLLLVACTNVAQLLLARGAARERELAVRHALGAGRSRLLRQLVTESVLVATFGGALAVVVGWLGLRVLAAVRPASLVALTHVSSGRGVLYLASGLAILCGVLVGLVTALRAAHRSLGIALRSGAWSTARSGRQLRSALVVGEVALSATLLVGALLLIHSVYDLQRTQLGFDARGLYEVSFPRPESEAPEARAAFATLVRERAVRIPGVERVALGASAPSPRGFRAIAAFETPEREVAPEAASEAISVRSASADYFQMLKMPLLAGNTFGPGSAQRHEVIVSASLARTIWPDGNAIGRRFRNAVSRSRGVIEPWQTVIGVVPDVVSNLVEGAYPVLYLPEDEIRVRTNRNVAVLIRAHGKDASDRVRELASIIMPGEVDVVVTNVAAVIGETLAEPRFTMLVLASFALLGVALAAIGLYGVVAYSVGQRTREIGVRLTIGATRSSIARLVVGDGVRLTMIGIAVGLGGAGLATRVLGAMLYGVSPIDAFAFGTGALVLLAVSITACVVPTLRAIRIDPTIAVRAE